MVNFGWSLLQQLTQKFLVLLFLCTTIHKKPTLAISLLRLSRSEKWCCWIQIKLESKNHSKDNSSWDLLKKWVQGSLWRKGYATNFLTASPTEILWRSHEKWAAWFSFKISWCLALELHIGACVFLPLNFIKIRNSNKSKEFRSIHFLSRLSAPPPPPLTKMWFLKRKNKFFPTF